MIYHVSKHFLRALHISFALAEYGGLCHCASNIASLALFFYSPSFPLFGLRPLSAPKMTTFPYMHLVAFCFLGSYIYLYIFYIQLLDLVNVKGRLSDFKIAERKVMTLRRHRPLLKLKSYGCKVHFRCSVISEKPT